MKQTKKERQQLLIDTLKNNLFITDDELSKQFSVSVQTIRLDRLELSIPELRERIKHVATKSFKDEVRSLALNEVIGEMVDIELDERAISIFDVKSEHIFKRHQIARGHHLFAQANSLAVAVINEELALTVKSNLSFVKPVKLGERVVAKAIVIRKDHEKKRTFVEVTSTVGNNIVFKGQFEMYQTNEISDGDFI